jgi:hypothetical protein
MKPASAGVAIAAAMIASATVARAEPDPKRKVVVLEYRAGSAALAGIADRVATRIGNLTSLRVIDPDAARQKIDGLDAAVVRCSGEAACLASIGGKLAVDEVIVVGVSELGDVILTLQRIGVREKSVSSRIAESLAADEKPSDAVIAKYLSRLLPPSDFVRFGMIKIVANLSGAIVKLGDEERGTTPVPPLKVPAPASYDIRVEKDGYVPFGASVAVPPDGEVEVRAQLTKRGGETRWYQKWWVLAIAGAAVVGASGAAIYVATRPGDTVPTGGDIERSSVITTASSPSSW